MLFVNLGCLFRFTSFRVDLQSSQLSLNLAPNREGSVLGQVLDVGAIGLESAISTPLLVLLTIPLGKSPLLGDVDLER